MAFQIASQRYQRAISTFDRYDTDDMPDEIFVIAEQAMEQVIDAGNKLLAVKILAPTVQAEIRQGLASIEEETAAVQKAQGGLH
jgi:hypothetical protein